MVGGLDAPAKVAKTIFRESIADAIVTHARH